MSIRQQLADALIRDPRAVKRIAIEARVDPSVTAELVHGKDCNPMLATLEKLCVALGYRMVIERVEQ